LKGRLLAGLDKYFGSIESNMLYSVATLLDPRFKKMHLQPLVVSNTMNRISRVFSFF